MCAKTNGTTVPAFTSYEDIASYLKTLQESGVTPDSIVILTPPPH